MSELSSELLFLSGFYHFSGSGFHNFSIFYSTLLFPKKCNSHTNGEKGVRPLFLAPFFRPFYVSLEGSLAHLNACFISGYIFLHFVPLPIPAYLTGVFVASISEVLPLGVNDNFSVPLLSASSMSIFFLF
jgi:hypothetical protein